MAIWLANAVNRMPRSLSTSLPATLTVERSVSRLPSVMISSMVTSFGRSMSFTKAISPKMLSEISGVAVWAAMPFLTNA